MNPRVVGVQTRSNYTLALTFDNGEFGLYKCSELLDFGVFKDLKDFDYFNQAHVLDGTVVWPHGQDICPDTLYLDSKKRYAG